MSTILPAILRYFRACYAADYKAVQLLNFYSNKITHPILLEEASLLEGTFMQVPLDTEWGRTVSAYLLLHSKEKQLYCGSFFLLGKTTLLGKPQRICAPLYLHTAEILHEQDVYYLRINESDPIINPSVIDQLKDPSVQTSVGLYEEITEQLPNGYLGFDQLQQLRGIMEKYFPELDVQTFDEYPALYQRAQLKTPKSGFKMVPAIGVGLMDKASGSMGVLNELEEIAQSSQYSTPLLELFRQKKVSSLSSKRQSIWLPISLSLSQENIIHSAAHHALSMVIGPPGTGKSFTIAALAIDSMSKGESVLIASKNTQAVNVVANKIEEEIGLKNIVVRASGQDYKKFLRRRLQDWLNGIGVNNKRQGGTRRLQRLIRMQEAKVKKLEKIALLRETYEIRHGEALIGGDSWWSQWKLYWLQRRLSGSTPIWEFMLDLEQQLQRLHTDIRIFLEKTFQQQLHKALRKHRQDLMHFLKGLKSKTGNEKGNYFANVRFGLILKALPIWVVNAADVHRVLPLEKELFDLVLIDEASQCDIASILPLIQRAKRIVVVGDPKQLRHISFLSNVQQQQLARQMGLDKISANVLDYRSKSLLDLVGEVLISQDQVHFLDEHFRSQPGIIAFSNKRFYQDALKVMTAIPSNQSRQSVYLHFAEGHRNSHGQNIVEAANILEKVDEIIERETPLHDTICQTIGILSPFRDQVNHLRKEAQIRFSEPQIQRHRLLIGTPFEFQGEERDIMLLSFVVDEQTPMGAYQYLNREDVFNVSITRARSEQLLFLSFDPKNLDKKSLLSHYLNSLDAQLHFRKKGENILPKDAFLQEVFHVLQSWEMKNIYVNYPIAGMNIDLVVVHETKTFCIDLIGFPGQFAEAMPIERWKILDRIGLKSFALPYSLWQIERDLCLRSLKKFLTK